MWAGHAGQAREEEEEEEEEEEDGMASKKPHSDVGNKNPVSILQ